MDPSTAQHHQEMGTQTLESMLVCTKTNQDQKKPRPQPEQAIKCPRCDSSNTKFCYYNNYSLTQPRYFCKSCRRYWTKGGTLRNVPVGGGCRKNKRSSSSKRSSQDPSSLTSNNNPSPLSSTSSLPPLSYDYSSDLSLAFAGLHKQSNGNLGFDDFSILGNNHNISQCDFLGNPNNHVTNIIQSSSHSTPSSFLDELRGGFGEAPNGFQNLNYGIGVNGNFMGNLENGGGMSMPYDHHQDHHYDHGSCATTTAVTVTTMKQEVCNGREGGDQNRVLWGFPWQIGGEGNNNMGEVVDSGRDRWINGIGSNWHGLINSPLM